MFSKRISRGCGYRVIYNSTFKLSGKRRLPGFDIYYFNLLKPIGYVMNQQFNIQQLYALPHCIYVFCVYLRTNSDMCQLQHKLTGFYN